MSCGWGLGALQKGVKSKMPLVTSDAMSIYICIFIDHSSQFLTVSSRKRAMAVPFARCWEAWKGEHSFPYLRFTINSVYSIEQVCTTAGRQQSIYRQERLFDTISELWGFFCTRCWLVFCLDTVRHWVAIEISSLNDSSWSEWKDLVLSTINLPSSSQKTMLAKTQQFLV